MNKEGTLSRNIPMRNSKISQQTNTPGAAQYLSLKPPYKEGQSGFPSRNQDPGLEST